MPSSPGRRKNKTKRRRTCWGSESQDSEEEVHACISAVNKGPLAQMQNDHPPAPREAAPTARGRQPKPTERYRPPSPPIALPGDAPAAARVVVKTKQTEGKLADDKMVAVQTRAIPRSQQTGRIMLGQLSLSKAFPKSYLSRDPIQESPIDNMTISSAWHMVRKNTK